MRLGAIALGCLFWAGCAAPRPIPTQAYEQGRKAGLAAYTPPPTTASELKNPAQYYRSLMTDVRLAPDRYYAGSAWHWESRNFRAGFVDGLVENLEARAQKIDAAARGTADDYALGKKMALDLGASQPDADFKSIPGRHPSDTRLHLVLEAETSYRTAYVDSGRGKAWDLQTGQFQTGFVDGFLELCGAIQAEREAQRSRRTPAEDYVMGLQAGRRAAALVDDEERAALTVATEEERGVLLAKHYQEGAAKSNAWDPAKESERFQDGFFTGFREACGLKE